MNFREKTELILVPVAGVLCWLAAPLLPQEVGFGALVIIGSGIILLQSLIRDLFILAYPDKKEGESPTRKARCICLESLVGVLGVAAGLIIIVTGLAGLIEMKATCWSLVVMAALITGFMIRDFVLELKPFRLYRDRNHQNIIVKWD